MNNSLSLDGQLSLVTGGSRGIGREITQALARAGAKVVITGRNRAGLDETVSLVSQQGGFCEAFEMDILDTDAVQAVIGSVINQFGSIDLLVNNAGVGGGGALPWETNVDDWWHVLEVNLRGVFACSQVVLKDMIKNKSGRIINLGSNAGFSTIPYASAYSVSKLAVLQFTKTLADAAKEHEVSAFVVSPGLVYTDMTRDIPMFKDIPASEWTPIEKVGELCVILATGKADQLTGRYIHVAEDDIQDLINRADEIIEKDLNSLHFLR